jgi:hypothetical protein
VVARRHFSLLQRERQHRVPGRPWLSALNAPAEQALFEAVLVLYPVNDPSACQVVASPSRDWRGAISFLP